MNSQTANWNRLEILLNETTPKKPSITPKSASKLDDTNQPRFLKCLRSKKGFKGHPTLNHLPSSNALIKCEATPTSAREKILTDPISSQTKSNNEIGTGIFVTLKETQKGSLEDIEQYSEFSDCEKNLFATGAYEDNDLKNEGGIKGLFRKFSSVGAIKSVPPARCTEWQRRQNFLVCQLFNEKEVSLKKYKSLCGVPDAEIRELYRFKCQDLKIGVFADSEEIFVQGAKKKSTENKLCLQESGFGPKSIEKLAQILQGNSKISQVCLRKSILNGDSMRVLAKSLALMPCLIHLELANNSIEPEDFMILFEELASSKSLVSIDFSNYEADRKNRLTVECLDAFYNFAHGNILLQYVKFINLMLEDEIVQGLLSALGGSPNLLSLNLSSNDFTGKCLEGLPSVLACTNLIKFNLSNNKLKKEGASQVARAIQGFKGANKEGLEIILENTYLGADINLIFAAFGRDTNVSKLNFGQNIFFNVEIIRLEYALGVNTKLTELNLSNCRLGQMGGRILALGLQKNKYIQNLVLVNNDLNDEVGAQIISSLIHNLSFKALDMSQNHLSSESAQVLQELIKKNSNVHRYNLSLNKFNEREGYLLQETLYFNSKITQFNLHHNPVKYNTIETVERILKDNRRKLLFQAVPKLKDELARKKLYIEDEKNTVEEALEMERVKYDVKRDVERFQETFDNLKTRPESPNTKKIEKVVIKQSKDLRSYAKTYSETVLKTRDFIDEALLEAESYKNELVSIGVQIQQTEKKIENKKRDIDDMAKKYEPEIKRLRFEISKLKDENNFIELYNDTLMQKIKKEKKKITLSNQTPNPKISDMFLATSELARHKKKHNEAQEKALESTKSRIGALESQSHLSQISEDGRVAKEYNLAVKHQKLRINQQLNINEKSETKNKKRKIPTKIGNPDQENVKERIKEKIKSLLTEASGPVGSILGQIADN